MILDLGCGLPNRYHKVLEGDNIIHVDISKRALKLDILCDAHNLPFKPDSFQTVYASHILEHLSNPTTAIQEMKRVTAKRVIISVPNASFYKWKNSSPTHIFSWNKFTLKNLLKRYFNEVTINSTQRNLSKNRFRKLVSLILTRLHGQNELTAICSK